LLENLSHQTRRPDEILIVDSSPDDETLNVVQSWQPKYPSGVLRFVKSERGLTLQRVVGIDNTVCDLILMLDDDVVLELNCLEVMEKFMDSDEGREFAGASAFITNEYGKDLMRYQRLYYRLGIYEELSPGRWLYCGDFLQLSSLKPFEGVYKTQFLPVGASIFRRNVLEEIRPDPSLVFGGEDKHLSLRISQAYPLGVLGSAHMRHEHLGAGRPSSFIYSRNFTRNRAKMLVECDPNPSKKRYVAFLAYLWLEFCRQTLLTLLLPYAWKRRSFEVILGKWYGWLWNLLSPPRRNSAEGSRQGKT
jgi:glycosyltransferase involved in cell wall biosynthesis